MATYRARHCPRCNYYLGFSIAKSPLKSKEISITSFCLNCSYKLPISRVIRGIRRTASPFRRAALRVAAVTKNQPTAGFETPCELQDKEKPFTLLDYPRHLRVIGQELENLPLKIFNLECTGEAYLVWSPGSLADTGGHPLSRLGKNRLQKLWKNRPQLRGQAEAFILPSSQLTRRYRYSLRDIERMEYQSRSQRSRKPSPADGHGLSQLLRTVGAMVVQRRERLLAISWQEVTISIVVETAQGQRQIDVFRPDNLYDIWVRMYLRRDNRALSDIPR
jgi:hypothetical protein